MSISSRRISGCRNTFLLGAFLLFLNLLLIFAAPPVNATPNTINYQGRLSNASGVNMPDGQYNMKFRIYDAATAGTMVYSTTFQMANRVTVTNGQFNVQLSNTDTSFSSDTRYLEVELPTPATATCSTVGCADYSEGPMTPRQPFASAAYAFQAKNADTLDGVDSLSFARKDSSNTFIYSNTFNSNVLIDSANSATKFVINDNSSVALFTADTSATIVKVGTTSAATLANVRLLTTSAEFTGTVRIGTATDGVDISAANGIVLSGTARRTKTATLTPEYLGATFQGDGSTNIGSLTSDFCSNTASLAVNTSACPTSGDAHNYYQWIGEDSGTQDYDIYIRYRMPSDYDTGSMTNLSQYNYKSTSGFGYAELYMYDSAGVNCSSLTASTAGVWTQATSATPIGSCTGIVANGYITFKVKLYSTNSSNPARIGSISFDYRSKF